MQIHIQQTGGLALQSQPDGQIGRYAAFADPALAADDQKGLVNSICAFFFLSATFVFQ
jgi:hypothetical protein